MLKLVLACSSHEQNSHIRERLKSDAQICCCEDSKQLLQLLFEIQPDIVIVDLMLPGGGSLDVIRSAKAAGLAFHTIALSSFYSDYILEQLQESRVEDAVLLPVQSEYLLDRIWTFQQKSSAKDESHYRRFRLVHTILRSLGFMHDSGYRYISFVTMMLYNCDEMISMKEIYAVLEEKFHCSYTTIEKAMRDSVKRAWNRRNECVWKEYFPIDERGKMSCPSISDFFAQIYLHFRYLKDMDIGKCQNL